MTAETATATEVMPTQDPPATVTVRRSWALGGLLAVAVVIVAMAIALAAVASDDGPDGGFQQGPPSGMPAISQSGAVPPQGMTPPEGMPDQSAMPQLSVPPDMPGQSSQGSSGSQSSPNPNQ